MKIRQILASTLTALLIAQMPAVAFADTSVPTDTSSATQTVSPTDSTTPTTDTSSTATDPSTSSSSTDTASTNTSTDTTPTTSPTAPTPPDSTGPSQPTGTPPSYAFNDSTRKWEPTIISSFTWDASTGYWISPFYTYDPVVGWYHVKAQVTPSDAINNLTAGSADPAGTLRSILGVDPSNSNTGPGSTNSSSLSNSNNLLANLLNNLSLSNFGSQSASSGDASVTDNTNGGSATTGPVAVVTNLLNLLNAMWTFSSGGFVSFIHNIFGDQTGDLNLSLPDASGGGGSLGSLACPAVSDSNSNTGPSSSNTASSTCDNNLDVHNQTNGSITNNLDILAQSGAATVADNTNGGNATSGDARAELNIVNLINSAIGAGQSFFGMINIFGNLNGDILFPQLGLNGAIGSSSSGGGASNTGTGPNSTNTATSSNQNNADISNSVNGAFNNNIDASASSGDATVANNTSAGSATTGSSSTNTSLFNLFDTSVFGDNAVLVIINDMGHWFGRIMNLDVSGASGGGLLTSNATVSNDNTGPSSSNTASSSNTNNLNLDNSTNGTITNNIRATANSGAATVANNTYGGNATSGNATVSSDIANIFGSHLNFKKVFGILFINVFGTWNGSVGVDTAAGNPVVATLVGTFVPVQVPETISGSSQSVGSEAGSGSSNDSNVSSLVGSGGGGGTQALLAAANNAAVQTAKKAADTTALLITLASVVMLLSGALLGIERRLSRNHLR